MFSLFVWVSLLLVRGNFEMWPALPDLSKSESICALNEGTLSAGCWVTKTTVNYKTERLKDMSCSHNIRHFQTITVFSQTFNCQLPSFLRVQFQSHIMPEQVVTVYGIEHLGRLRNNKEKK